ASHLCVPRPPSYFGHVHLTIASCTNGRDARILIGTGNGFLIDLDARTGKPFTGFGVDGRVDLTEGLGRTVDRMWYTVTSPPLIVGDLVVVGSSIQSWPIRPDMPPGHIRAFDVRTGAQRWIFHSIPQAGGVGPGNRGGAGGARVGGAGAGE